MADIPNFGALAQQQYDQNTAATDKTNLANRPDQYNALGSNTWAQGPGGTWTQTSNLNGGAQNLFNTTLSGQQGLAGTIGAGVNYGNLPAMPNSGFGASQQVIDAWNALQQPGLDKSAEAARARAAAMGMTLGSNGWGDVERTIGTNEATSRNQGILQGTQEYQNVFNRGLQARQQGVTEANNQYDRAISGSSALGGVRDSLNPNKWNATVPTSAGYKPLDLLGAAQETFNAQTSNENQATANRNANINSGINALGAAGGLTGIGNLLGGASNALGGLWGSNTGLFGGGDASLWNQWTGTGSYNYDVNNLGMDSPAYQDNSSFWGGYQPAGNT